MVTTRAVSRSPRPLLIVGKRFDERSSGLLQEPAREDLCALRFHIRGFAPRKFGEPAIALPSTIVKLNATMPSTRQPHVPFASGLPKSVTKYNPNARVAVLLIVQHHLELIQDRVGLV